MVIDDKVTGHQINAKFVVVADAQGKRIEDGTRASLRQAWTDV